MGHRAAHGHRGLTARATPQVKYIQDWSVLIALVNGGRATSVILYPFHWIIVPFEVVIPYPGLRHPQLSHHSHKDAAGSQAQCAQ